MLGGMSTSFHWSKTKPTVGCGVIVGVGVSVGVGVIVGVLVMVAGGVDVGGTTVSVGALVAVAVRVGVEVAVAVGAVSAPQAALNRITEGSVFRNTILINPVLKQDFTALDDREIVDLTSGAPNYLSGLVFPANHPTED